MDENLNRYLLLAKYHLVVSTSGIKIFVFIVILWFHFIAMFDLDERNNGHALGLILLVVTAGRRHC